MSNEFDDTLGIYTQWAEGFSRTSLRHALKDQVVLARGQLNDGDEAQRYTPAGRSESEYDTVRATRDDLDYREWNEDTGYSGVTRWPQGPGMAGNGIESENQKRRRARKEQLDNGF